MRDTRTPFRTVALLIIAAPYLLGSTSSWALDPGQAIGQLHHTAWTPIDGAPGGAWSMAQTQDGWLWFGGPTGLYRFDGLHFERFEIAPYNSGLSQAISALLPLDTGALWIGRAYGGASVLLNGSASHYGPQEGFGPGRVLAFEQDGSHAIWAATAGGLLRFDGRRWSKVEGAWNYPDEGAVALARDHAGTLWVAGLTQIFSLQRGTREFRVTGIRSTPQTRFVAAPDGRVFYFDSTELHPLPVTVGYAPGDRRVATRASASVIVDRDDTLWFATNHGIKRQALPVMNVTTSPDRRAGESFSVDNGLSGELINTLLEDREGNIWTATAGGIDRFRHTNVNRLPPSVGAPIHIGFAAGENGGVWLASQETLTPSNNDGVWQYDGRLRHVQPEDLASATAIHRDLTGHIWIGGRKGIWRYDGRQFSHVLDPPEAARGDDVQALAVDAAGDIWASFVHSSLYRYRAGAWQVNGGMNRLPGGRPTVQALDPEGRLWLGYRTNQAALVDGERVTLFGEAEGVNLATIAAISAGRYTLLGGDRGLALRLGPRFVRLQATDPTAVDSVFGIVETSAGDVWLNTWRGAVRIPAEEMQKVRQTPDHELSVEIFDSDDGYPGSGKMTRARPLPTMAQTSDGRIWLAGQDGLAWIDPARIRRNGVAPPVFINEIRTNGHREMALDNVTAQLPEGTRGVQIDYLAMSYSRPERVRFRYQLEGIDEKFVDAGGRREVFYSNLGPGHYRFHVIACNDAGLWNLVGAAVSFSILPAWYQTSWFIVLCSLIGALSLYLIYRARMHRLAQAYSARFDERLAERTSLARDLHDTLLQTIQGSKMVADNALAGAADPDSMRRTMRQLATWLDQAIMEGRTALNSLRASSVQSNDLSEGLRRAIDALLLSRNMQTSVAVVGGVRHLHPIARDEVYLIAHEAIRNAFLHSTGGRLEVEMTYGRHFELRVRDNGQGMDATALRGDKMGHFGVRGMRERAGRLRGNFNIVTSPTEGTTVILSVPGILIYARERPMMRNFFDVVRDTFRRQRGRMDRR